MEEDIKLRNKINKEMVEEKKNWTDETLIWYIILMIFCVIGYVLAKLKIIEFAIAFIIGAIICLYKQISSNIKQTKEHKKFLKKLSNR